MSCTSPFASDVGTGPLHLAIARALAANGVRTIFGLIGDGNLYVADSFAKSCDGRFVPAMHEAGAMLMALGYASVSRKLGVATVTHGPGLTNTITALVEGVKGRIPSLLLCGETSLSDPENFQALAQRELVLSTGAGYEKIRFSQTAMDDVARAIRRALQERRPIVLAMPVDLMAIQVPLDAPVVSLPSQRLVVLESEDLDNAIGIIASARRPIVLAGQGACDDRARSSLIKLAERIGAPLATTLKASGLFAGEPYDLGVFGTLSHSVAVEAIINSDCVIAFGASLNRHTTSDGTFINTKRVVHVDLDASQLSRYIQPASAIVGDAASTADLFVQWLDKAGIPSSEYCQPELAGALKGVDVASEVTSEEKPAFGVNLANALSAIDAHIDLDRIVVTDAGRFIIQPWKILRVARPGQFVFTINFGSIGLGLAEAVGATEAAPKQTVVLVTGDGGFMLGGLTELNAAVLAGANLIVLVFNDGGYGAEYVQFRRKSMDPSLSLFERPDLALVARSLGAEGVRMASDADLPQVLEAIRSRKRPLLIDIILDPESIPAARGPAQH